MAALPLEPTEWPPEEGDHGLRRVEEEMQGVHAQERHLPEAPRSRNEHAEVADGLEREPAHEVWPQPRQNHEQPEPDQQTAEEEADAGQRGLQVRRVVEAFRGPAPPLVVERAQRPHRLGGHQRVGRRADSGGERTAITKSAAQSD